MVEPVDIKRFVNEILGKKGVPPVKNLAKEFSDGSKTYYNRITSFNSSFPNSIQHFIWWKDRLQARKI